VFHLAANADIRGGLTHPRKDLEQNTLVTFNVLEMMREAGVKRIIFSSTAAALGEPEVFPTPETCAIPVQTSLYGASKMACEGLISSYCEGYGFEGYVFRFVSLLGPRYPHGHVFDFVRKLRVDPTRLHILGDGRQRKSYLHIEDCLDALLLICEVKRTAKDTRRHFEVYHLGVQEYCSVEQSAGWISTELGLTPKLEYSGGERGWIGDNPFVFLDVSKAIATGWAPKHTIEQSVRETARWLSDNSWIFNKR
jgi:UDP-glucose 4-epimerase